MAYILNKKTIATVSRQLQHDGHQVILTHGTFDLFHIGHWEFLKSSKKLGDILIVGVDSDKRARHFKGQTRPIIPYEYRAKVLTAIKEVDFVFVLSEENRLAEKYYIDLYHQIHPTTVTFGRNFAFKDQYFRKGNLIRGVTYQEVATPYNPPLSTTAIINRIKSLP